MPRTLGCLRNAFFCCTRGEDGGDRSADGKYARNRKGKADFSPFDVDDITIKSNAIEGISPLPLRKDHTTDRQIADDLNCAVLINAAAAQDTTLNEKGKEDQLEPALIRDQGSIPDHLHELQSGTSMVNERKVSLNYKTYPQEANGVNDSVSPPMMGPELFLQSADETKNGIPALKTNCYSAGNTLVARHPSDSISFKGREEDLTMNHSNILCVHADRLLTFPPPDNVVFSDQHNKQVYPSKPALLHLQSRTSATLNKKLGCDPIEQGTSLDFSTISTAFTNYDAITGNHGKHKFNPAGADVTVRDITLRRNHLLHHFLRDRYGSYIPTNIQDCVAGILSYFRQSYVESSGVKLNYFLKGFVNYDHNQLARRRSSLSEIMSDLVRGQGSDELSRIFSEIKIYIRDGKLVIDAISVNQNERTTFYVTLSDKGGETRPPVDDSLNTADSFQTDQEEGLQNEIHPQPDRSEVVTLSQLESSSTDKGQVQSVAKDQTDVQSEDKPLGNPNLESLKQIVAAESLPEMGHLFPLQQVRVQEMWQKFKNLKTKHGFTLETGIERAEHHYIPNIIKNVKQGVVAGDEDTFSIFDKIYEAAIPQERNGYKRTVSLAGDNSILKQVQLQSNQRLDTSYVTKVKTSVFRSLKGFPFAPFLNVAQRNLVMHLLKECAGPANGQFISLETSDPAERKFLAERNLTGKKSGHHGFFQWPKCRGVILFEDTSEEMLAKVNFVEHLQIIISNRDGDIMRSAMKTMDKENAIKEQLKSLEQTYCFDPKYGYLNSQPINLGLAMTISTKVRLPKLSQLDIFGDLLHHHKLNKLHRAPRENKYDEVVELQNADKFASSEIELLQEYQNSIHALIQMEKCLEEEASFDHLLPQAFQNALRSKTSDKTNTKEDEIEIDKESKLVYTNPTPDAHQTNKADIFDGIDNKEVLIACHQTDESNQQNIDDQSPMTGEPPCEHKERTPELSQSIIANAESADLHSECAFHGEDSGNGKDLEQTQEIPEVEKLNQGTPKSSTENQPGQLQQRPQSIIEKKSKKKKKRHKGQQRGSEQSEVILQEGSGVREKETEKDNDGKEQNKGKRLPQNTSQVVCDNIVSELEETTSNKAHGILVEEVLGACAAEESNCTADVSDHTFLQGQEKGEGDGIPFNDTTGLIHSESKEQQKGSLPKRKKKKKSKNRGGSKAQKEREDVEQSELSIKSEAGTDPREVFEQQIPLKKQCTELDNIETSVRKSRRNATGKKENSAMQSMQHPPPLVTVEVELGQVDCGTIKTENTHVSKRRRRHARRGRQGRNGKSDTVTNKVQSSAKNEQHNNHERNGQELNSDINETKSHLSTSLKSPNEEQSSVKQLPSKLDIKNKASTNHQQISVAVDVEKSKRATQTVNYLDEAKTEINLNYHATDEARKGDQTSKSVTNVRGVTELQSVNRDGDEKVSSIVEPTEDNGAKSGSPHHRVTGVALESKQASSTSPFAVKKILARGELLSGTSTSITGLSSEKNPEVTPASIRESTDLLSKRQAKVREDMAQLRDDAKKLNITEGKGVDSSDFRAAKDLAETEELKDTKEEEQKLWKKGSAKSRKTKVTFAPDCLDNEGKTIRRHRPRPRGKRRERSEKLNRINKINDT